MIFLVSIGVFLAGCEEIQGGPEKECFEYYKNHLVRPGSAKLESHRTSGETMTIRVSAESRAGFTRTESFKCHLNDGQFSLADTIMARLEDQEQAQEPEPEKCKIKNWTYRRLTAGHTQIDGETTCRSGSGTIRVFDGDKYLGNAPAMVSGHAFTTYLQADPPKVMRIEYEIEAD